MDEFGEMLRLNALEEEIIKRYEAGERNFAGIDLRFINISYSCFMDTNFSGANLQVSAFRNIYLVNINFTNANLQGAIFSGYLIGCNLSNTNLRGVDFEGTNLTGVDLTGADMTGANLSGANLIGTNLRNANLTSAKITESTIFCNTIMPDGRIENKSSKVIDSQELLKRYAEGEKDFRDIFLDRVDLSGVNLQSINLCGAHLSHVNLQGAFFEGEISAHFICCDMRDARLICTSPDYGNQPRFTCCDLRRVQMGGGIDTFGAIGNNFQGSNAHFRCDDGDIFIHNSTWFNGEFIAGPVWLMEYWGNIREIDPSDF